MSGKAITELSDMGRGVRLHEKLLLQQKLLAGKQWLTDIFWLIIMGLL